MELADSQRTRDTLKQLTIALWFTGAVVGFVVAIGILAGDAQGRVNLLYVLLLLALLPAIALVLSLVFLASGAGRGLAGMVLSLPLWPRHWRRQVHALQDFHAQKSWLFYQTQVLTLSFGLGGLLAFFLLLLGTDVSFVWRSTLLRAEDLLPVLRGLALPWWPWEAAQPSLELLRATRDFRVEPSPPGVAALGLWWKYVLAAQCTYNIIPRTIMLLVARHHYLARLRLPGQPEFPPEPDKQPMNRVPEEGPLAGVVRKVPGSFELIDWAGAPAFCLEHVERRLGAPKQVRRAGPLPGKDRQAAGAPASDSLVVLVKSWEPPMGELRDYLQDKSGYLLPLDWDENGVRPTASRHLQEWRRFCGELAVWQVVELAS